MKAGRNQPCPCGSGRKYKQCCMGKDAAAAGNGDGPGRGAHAVLDEVLAELRSGAFRSEEEANTYLAARVAGYNAGPRNELSGLSPAQAQAVLDGQWDDGPLRLSDDLTLDELGRADFLHNARTLLMAVDDRGGVPATAAGNLKRAFVADMLGAMRWPEDWLELVRKVNKVVNEQDVELLHELRVVLEVGGLLRRRKGRFSVTARGRDLLPDKAAGRLMAHLFRTFFRDYNIGYGGRGPDTDPIQYGVPLFLARLPREAADWVDRRRLARTLLPPHLTPPDPEAEHRGLGIGDIRSIQVSVHFLQPLGLFGLLEERSTGDPIPLLGKVEVRVAPLFRRFITVSFR